MLAGTGWGPVTVVARTGSTNADVAALARAGAGHGTVLVTPHQQAGRGRFARVWSTPPDTCVAMSVLVRPRLALAHWGWLSLVAGLAAVAGVAASSGVEATLKWPNDVLVAERKLCGILSEAVETPAGWAAVLGIGINVALGEDQLPVPTATSLRLEGSDAAAHAVAAAVLVALDRLYARWDAGESLVADYRRSCGTLGRRVRILVPDGAVEGLAVDVDAAGALVVDTEAGRRTFAAGDVVHLRPADAGPGGFRTPPPGSPTGGR
nr:biotin--[acetyl-CoA-carboxylase] ligase [Propionibacterium sp.]